MRTTRQARLLLPGTRPRVYDIEIVDLGGSHPARFLVNFRYGWHGTALAEGTRTPDAVTQDQAERMFDSLVAARRNQGYRLAGEAAPEPARPVLAAVAPHDDARTTILGARLRGLDALADLDAAAVLRRVGELRLTRLAPHVAAAAHPLILDGRRLAALRVLPFVLHRTDDGSGKALALLGRLAGHADVPVAETAAMLQALSAPDRAPPWTAFSTLIQAMKDLPQPDVRNAAVVSYFQAAAGSPSIGTANPAMPASAAVTADLRALYVRGAHEPTARAMLLAALAALPLQPPLFPAVRRILQVAEATDDSAVLAILLRRFDDEISPVQLAYADQSGQRRAYVGSGLVRVAEEAAKATARIAYTPATRAYLRRRGWRTMRRLGEAGDPAYVAHAEAILLTLDDAEIQRAAAGRATAERPRASRQAMPDGRLPAFADRYAAHHILHGRQEQFTVSTTTLRWRRADRPAGDGDASQAPFPELWAARPEALWRLVTTGKAALVVAFAAREVRANTAFLDTVPTAGIAALIAGWAPFAARLDLGIWMAEQRIAREGLQVELALALIGEPRRGGPLVRLFIGARAQLLADDPVLFAALLAGCAAESFAWLDPLARQAALLASPATRATVLAAVLASVTTARGAGVEMARAKALGTLLTGAFKPEIVALDGALIRALDGDQREPVQLLAATLAAARPDGADLVDTGRLAQSADADLRAAGVALFAQRPLDDITRDLDAVARFLTADAPEPRTAARPIAARLAAERPEAARALAEKLLGTLYRTETHEGLRDDVYRVLSEDLRNGVIALGPETVWRLLRARAEPARRLGADVLAAFKAGDFSIRQLARIGGNDQVRARRWALAQMQARIADVRAAPEEGFALLDSTFEDARNSGYDLYRTHLQPEDWSPAALVALSDATTEPAQRFGREMIGRVFEAKNADYLLSRLAEHPATGFRLLVARLMRDYVKDDVQRLRRLVPAIETTLLQVRRGRAAKDQVFSFLEEQLARDAPIETRPSAAGREPSAVAAPNEARAAIVASILERIVATCAIEDRARAVSILAALKQRNPALAPRAIFVPREARG